MAIVVIQVSGARTFGGVGNSSRNALIGSALLFSLGLDSFGLILFYWDGPHLQTLNTFWQFEVLILALIVLCSSQVFLILICYFTSFDSKVRLNPRDSSSEIRTAIFVDPGGYNKMRSTQAFSKDSAEHVLPATRAS